LKKENLQFTKKHENNLKNIKGIHGKVQNQVKEISRLKEENKKLVKMCSDADSANENLIGNTTKLEISLKASGTCNDELKESCEDVKKQLSDRIK
jgi:septal ring factor EnvC (AmiA/AmiB activator)